MTTRIEAVESPISDTGIAVATKRSFCEMVRLLCTTPRPSDRRISLASGLSLDTVRRTRRVLAAKGWAWQELASLAEKELKAKLHRTRRGPRKTPLDLERVRLILLQPGATVNDVFQDYLKNAKGPHLGLSSVHYFTRRHLRFKKGWAASDDTPIADRGRKTGAA
jgi:hypothetical protein